jgi:asparagine synthase (glutamine-hydrolysing)
VTRTTAAVSLHGADPATVRDALASGDPLPGTAGFAGRVDDRLVRDVLGRQPVFHDGPDWSFDPTDLDEPTLLPAGHVRDLGGDTSEDVGDVSGDGTAGDDAHPTSRPVWHLPARDPAPFDDAVAATVDAVAESVDAVDPDGLAVAFSGGVDSALVASGVPEAPCYVAGFPDSHDVAAARAAAEAMDHDLRVVELDHEALERAVPEVVRATGRANPMDVNIALPLYLLAERVAADGYDRLAVGQGADELFGGYAKVANAPDDERVAADSVRGATREVVATLPEQLPRDVLALRATGVEAVAPLLHDRVVDAALDLPGEALVADGTRKVSLRAAARAGGRLPESVTVAEKKAVQYGSLVSRELDRLARQAGFKRRMPDHVGQYVASLVDGE